MSEFIKPTWEPLKIFNKPVKGHNIRFVPTGAEIPEILVQKAQLSWNNELKELQAKLKHQEGIESDIRPYHENLTSQRWNALYGADRCIRWPGPCLALIDLNEQESNHEAEVDLVVAQSYRPFFNILNDPDSKKILKKHGLSKWMPPLDICTYLITQDGKIALSLRGPKVTYQNMYYGIGGNPETLEVSIIQHQQQEIADEVQLSPDEYQPNFYFGGLVTDQDLHPGKPSLDGWIGIPQDSEELVKIFSQRPIELREPDAIEVHFAPTSEDALFDFIVKKGANSFCAPGLGALSLFGYHHFGQSWSEKLNQALF